MPNIFYAKYTHSKMSEVLFLIKEAGPIANVSAALLADGLQATQARDTREMLKTTGTMLAGRFAWEQVKGMIELPSSADVAAGKGKINFSAIGMQSVVQGAGGWLASMLVGPPRTFTRSWIDALAGSAAEAFVVGSNTPS